MVYNNIRSAIPSDFSDAALKSSENVTTPYEVKSLRAFYQYRLVGVPCTA